MVHDGVTVLSEILLQCDGGMFSLKYWGLMSLQRHLSIGISTTVWDTGVRNNTSKNWNLSASELLLITYLFFRTLPSLSASSTRTLLFQRVLYYYPSDYLWHVQPRPDPKAKHRSYRTFWPWLGYPLGTCGSVQRCSIHLYHTWAFIKYLDTLALLEPIWVPNVRILYNGQVLATHFYHTPALFIPGLTWHLRSP